MAASRPKPDTVTSIREKLRQAAKDSGMTQEEIGLRGVVMTTPVCNDHGGSEMTT